MKKAIIFDLYDTLITVRKKSKPYLYLLSHCNCPSKEIINELMLNSYSANGFISYLEKYGKLKTPIDTIHFLKLLDDELESTELYNDTILNLERLKKKYRLFCLSNLATPYKHPYYDLNLENYIEQAFFSCDEGFKKPNPDFFQLILDYSGLNKEDFIMIGDNQISDIKAANDFGIDARLKTTNLTSITYNL